MHIPNTVISNEIIDIEATIKDRKDIEVFHKESVAIADVPGLHEQGSVAWDEAFRIGVNTTNKVMDELFENMPNVRFAELNDEEAKEYK